MSASLFSPLRLRDAEMSNRVVVAPMCQYMAQDGVPQDWHMVHLGQYAQSNFGLIIAEATGVSPEGRITPGCTGLYSDAAEAAFARIITFARSVGNSLMGVQLSHAGRKASTAAPWDGAGTLVDGAWQTVAPSNVPYLPGWPEPMALDAAGMAQIKADFVAATARAARAGFDLVELHAAHGYLLHEFLSPITNQRTDEYGGSLENRMRFVLEIFEAVRAEFPADRPVILRLSATDWIEGGWDIADAVILSRELAALGCDMIHVSSGGLDQRQQIVPGAGYQVEFSQAIRAQAGVPTIAVGQITQAIQAETILRTGQADAIALARGALWNPRWAWHAAAELGQEVTMPAPYARCNPALRGKPFVTRKALK